MDTRRDILFRFSIYGYDVARLIHTAGNAAASGTTSRDFGWRIYLHRVEPVVFIPII
jgi:hypothetical protein